MTAEKLLTIPSFPDYLVSDRGRVFRRFFRNRHGAKQLDPPAVVKQIPSFGYMRVFLTVNGVRKSAGVHRLVLDAFSGPCPVGFEASHLDGCRSNNAISNLVWESRSDNHKRKHDHGTAQVGDNNPFASLSETDVRSIKRLLSKGTKQRDIAARFGVVETTISSIKHGRSWGHV